MKEFTRCRLINRVVKNYVTMLSIVPIIDYKSCHIHYNSVNSFIISNRQSNDKENKIRESVISAVINDKVPNEYYALSNRWSVMKYKINEFIHQLVESTNPGIDIHTINCKNKGGRCNNYDFVITVNNVYSFHIEFKFNAANVNKTPQFVSPMKPGQYLSESYEEYYYTNYIPILSQISDIQPPDKEMYLQQIHLPNPPCMKLFQDKYYKGCKESSQYTGNIDDIRFYTKSKELSKRSISHFIEHTDLNIHTLTSYLLKSQSNKFYMLYKDGSFRLETVDINEYELVSCEKHPLKACYISTSKTGKKIKILLRWKNGNGIAFPAFQITALNNHI